MLITGASSGIGLGLARAALTRGTQVLALQRRSSPLLGESRFSERLHDLTDETGTAAAVQRLLGDRRRVDLVVLNAGVLGTIADLNETSLDDIRRVMEINTWANKTLLDALFGAGCTIDQVVGISSGAAVSGNRGWNAYALSKAAFVMLLKLYAAERPQTHFCSVAPGLVDTAMQDVLCSRDAATMERFPSLQRIASRRGTPDMPSPDGVAERLLDCFEAVRTEPSGAFVDIRNFTPR